jgi:hypothetical protein
MRPMPTIPQPLSRNIQVPVTEDAYRRIKMEGARRDIPMGRVISNLAEEHLPEPEIAA